MKTTGRYSVDFKQVDTGEWERHLVLNSDDLAEIEAYYGASVDGAQLVETILAVRITDHETGETVKQCAMAVECPCCEGSGRVDGFHGLEWCGVCEGDGMATRESAIAYDKWVAAEAAAQEA